MTATTGSPRRSHAVRWAAAGVGIVMVLLVVLLVSRDPRGDQIGDSPVLGKQAPATNGDALRGRPFDMGTNDRWLVVNFFATWCVPCVQEHPELDAFQQEHAATGKANVISVVYGNDTAKKIQDFFDEHGGDWSVLSSDGGRTALDWGVTKVPESFLVAPSGIVVERFISGVTQQQLNSVIERYEQAAAEAQQEGS